MTSSGLVSPHHQDDRLRTIQIGPVKIRRLLSMLEHLEVTGLEEFTCIVRDHGDNPGAGIAWLSIMERVALNTRLAKIRISAVLGEQDELPIITSSCLLPLATCSHVRLFSLAASSTDEDSAPVWLYDDLGRLLRAWPRLEELCICHPVLDAAAPSFVGLVPIGLLEDVRRLCPALARIELAVDPDTAVEWAPAIPDVPCLREVHVRVEIHALTVAEITGKVYILYPHANVRVRAGGLSSTGAVGEEGNSMQELHRIALYHKESCCIQGVEDEQDDE
ncbi:hypothetical protein CALVIDRAFT_569939 [Calocera viscosa TUFC12733]|uniref:F-box domain-containing protein n=1 Tax=Calocera viscosa (strain TUFC12733) TaxID=1330018 RepID=A0A167FEK5_CALVF|nr:hypothetical protein CALVIDRAFT_569939 [Calocera viscosa TUFC12733]